MLRAEDSHRVSQQAGLAAALGRTGEVASACARSLMELCGFQAMRLTQSPLDTVTLILRS